MPMTDWNRLGAAFLGSWLAACGRVEESTTDAGGSTQAAGAAAGGRTGAGGQPTIDLVVTPHAAGEPGFYPPPFDARTCPTPVSGPEGTTRCVTRAELTDSGWPDVTLDGGVSALGSADAWRCPQLNEITFSGAGGGEHYCKLVLCGPLTQRNSTANSGANDAGAAGDGGAGTSEQTCCYYIVEQCGV